MAEKSMREQIEEAAASLNLEVVDREELAATREMASMAPGWKREAERLAGFLWAANPDHPIWNDQTWSAFAANLRNPDGDHREPDRETEALVAQNVTTEDVMAANARVEAEEQETMVDRSEVLDFLETEGKTR